MILIGEAFKKQERVGRLLPGREGAETDRTSPGLCTHGGFGLFLQKCVWRGTV